VEQADSLGSSQFSCSAPASQRGVGRRSLPASKIAGSLFAGCAQAEAGPHRRRVRRYTPQNVSTHCSVGCSVIAEVANGV